MRIVSIRCRRLAGLLRAIAMAIAVAPVAHGQMSEPRPLTEAASQATRARMAADPLGNVFIATVQGNRVKAIVLGSALFAETVLSDINIPQSEPSVALGSRGVAHVVFTQEDNELGAGGREVFLASNPGGAFGPARNVSLNKIDDHSPALAVDRAGFPRVVWVQGEGSAARLFLFDGRQGRMAGLGEGERPALAADDQGLSLVAYCRGRDILLLRETPLGFDSPVAIAQVGEVETAFPRVGVDAQGRVAIVFAAAGEIRLATIIQGNLGALRVLDTGLRGEDPAVEARLEESGRFTASYLKLDGVHRIHGDIEGDLASAIAFPFLDGLSSPSLSEDGQGVLHLSFIRGGRVFYANSAVPPSADFSADRVEGELPLAVKFEDTSSGHVRLWRWNFGDGFTSTDRNPVHVYQESGTYSVQLEVVGPGGSSRTERKSLITVRDPSNTMRVVDMPVLSGQKEVWVPVLGFHREDVQGFQVAGRFDPRALSLRELTTRWTFTEEIGPELFAPSISNEDGYFTLGVAFDYQDPFDGRRMPAGADQRLVFLIFDVLPGAALGETRIALGEGIGPSGLGCLYTVDGFTRLPVVTAGVVQVLSREGPPIPRLFLRGDVDRDEIVGLTDGIKILGFLFVGESLVSCADASDADDTGSVDLSDAIFLLVHLFLGGPPLPLPYPAAGLDLTADELPVCNE